MLLVYQQPTPWMLCLDAKQATINSQVCDSNNYRATYIFSVFTHTLCVATLETASHPSALLPECYSQQVSYKLVPAAQGLLSSCSADAQFPSYTNMCLHRVMNLLGALLGCSCVHAVEVGAVSQLAGSFFSVAVTR